MKNKKLIAIILGIACIAVLVGTLALNQKPKHEFAPEVTESSDTDSWEEKQTVTEPSILPESRESSGEAVSTTGTITDNTQTVVSEEAETVVSDLTPSTTQAKEKAQADTKPTTPPAESEKNGVLPSCDSVPPSETAATQQETKAEQTQALENANHDGQVYDPLFGWITPSPVQGQVIDNDGDINKQVGSMDSVDGQ